MREELCNSLVDGEFVPSQRVAIEVASAAQHLVGARLIFGSQLLTRVIDLRFVGASRPYTGAPL